MSGFNLIDEIEMLIWREHGGYVISAMTGRELKGIQLRNVIVSYGDYYERVKELGIYYEYNTGNWYVVYGSTLLNLGRVTRYEYGDNTLTLIGTNRDITIKFEYGFPHLGL